MIAELASRVVVLEEVVRRLRNTTIVGQSRTESLGGVSFGSSSEDFPEDPMEKFVALVKAPVESDGVLYVRELKYQGTPAIPCSEQSGSLICHLAWLGFNFEAFPLFGKKVSDYAEDYTEGTNPDTPVPLPDTKPLRCFRNHDSWIVDKVEAGGNAVIPVRVLGTLEKQADGSNSPTATHLLVMPIKAVASGVTGDTTYVDVGNPLNPDDIELARCWPHFLGRHYLTTINVTPPVVHDMVVIDGVPYVKQTFRFSTASPNTSYPAGGCPLL